MTTASITAIAIPNPYAAAAADIIIEPVNDFLFDTVIQPYGEFLGEAVYPVGRFFGFFD